ncbi:tyrosine--tRNA ligase [Anthocerotibacter panamensis]|uniref:tyrosine--tRNA ligase n=1 Tax=Anthocerotibacter panamensis TaxID=2857077 RepID=UPI001C406D58|nr:tyrosine--tRNA ligase [Anthocerotibacter panamensis]
MSLATRGVVEIFPGGAATLEQRITPAGQPLRVKLGVDPTRPDLHLGHMVALNKLRQFQDLGHVAVLIIGDFTALIGDPTGRSEARPRLTPEAVAQNAATYLDQARKVLDFDTPGRLEIHRNSEWLARLDLSKIIDLLATMTLQQMLAKEGFRERYDQQQPVYLHEFLYPLMQGYDSVAVRADLELGGTDQKFNLAVGRDLQIHYGQIPQLCLLVPLLVGLDGVKKMSKSFGNYVGISEDPLTMYQKLEKVPDALVASYFSLLTTVDLSTLPQEPRARQRELARTLTALLHGPAAAEQAQKDAFNLTQGQTDLADNVPEFSLEKLEFPALFTQVLKAADLFTSTSDARRRIQEGGVRLEGEKVTDVNLRIERSEVLANKIVQVGKKVTMRFVRENAPEPINH